MHKRACYDGGDAKTNIPDVVVGSSANATMTNSIANITIGATYLELGSTRTIGIFVKTSVKKRFIVRRDVDVDYGGRVLIRAYDSGDSVLTSAGGGHPYVIGEGGRDYSWSASYGGVYRSGTDNEADRFFTVGTDVDYVCVLITGGTANLRTRGFSIFSVDGGNPTTWTEYEAIDNLGVVTHVATGNVTLADHGGRLNLLGEVGGDAAVTLTLPEAVGSGAVYKFIVSVVNTSNYVIKTADATNCGIYGTLNILDVDSNAQTAYAGVAADDVITLNGTTTGGQLGDWLELTDFATDKWSVRGNLVCPAGSNVADPFSSS